MNMHYTDKVDDALSAMFNKVDGVTDWKAAKKTLDAAWEIFNDIDSHGGGFIEGDVFFHELLLNDFHYDGKDYTGYLPEGFEPDYDGALVIYTLNSIEQLIEFAKECGYKK